MESSRAFNGVSDSGKRQDFATGSRRDTRDGKGRFDLIPALFLTRLAKHFENGATKYGDRNWEKGQPLSRYLDSALRHLMAVQEGREDEDHLAAAAWNVQALMVTLEWCRVGRLPVSLIDLPYQLPEGSVDYPLVTEDPLVGALFAAAKSLDTPLPEGAVVITPNGRFKMGKVGLVLDNEPEDPNKAALARALEGS
jgi:Domain of unknown function (DUF5664)